MLFKMLGEEEECPRLDNKRKIEPYCQNLIYKLLDNDISTKLFKDAVDIVDNSALDVTDKLHIKQSSMVDELISTFNRIYKSNS